MEVDVRDIGQRAASAQRPPEIAERVRGGYRAQKAPRGEPDASRRLERRPALSLRQIRRPNRPRRAVDIPELGARFGDLGVGVPPASAEERWGEAELSHARAFRAYARARIATCGSSVVRSRPVSVMAERAAGCGFPSATEP